MAILRVHVDLFKDTETVFLYFPLHFLMFFVEICFVVLITNKLKRI